MPQRHIGVKACGRVALIALLVVACSADQKVPSTTVAPSTTSSDATSTTTSTVAFEDLPECVPGNPQPGIDLRYEGIIGAYESRNEERLVGLIGDGPVWDPSLEPNVGDFYPNLAVWLEAASRMEDQWSDRGYGFYEPFELFIDRSNPTLAEAGIDGLSVTFQFWVTQDCELRVGSTDVISHPDACRYFELYDPPASPDGCLGPFEPRASHAAVWTGSELLIYGGSNGADVVEPLRTGLAYDPESDTWRDLSPTPVGISWWPDLKAVWTGDRLIMIGGVVNGDEYGYQVLQYQPEADTWETASFPEERSQVGGVVWTGDDLLLVGGDLNGPDNTAWAYRPDTAEWRRLSDPGIKPVEGIEGIWTGSEAIFAGGYTGAEPFPAVAYDPALDSWRHLPSPLGRQLDHHEMVWTGSEAILYSGHGGPGHFETLMIYDSDTDSWSESAPMPMLPADRLAGAWTGDRLIIWGGYATYGEHDADGDAVFGHGATYDPAIDQWELLPEAPISDRCDHSGTWTGTEFIVFGGMPLCGTPGILPLGDAAAFNPATDTWRLLER
jgi:N-acetylneuraminic acid mutarotase